MALRDIESPYDIPDDSPETLGEAGQVPFQEIESRPRPVLGALRLDTVAFDIETATPADIRALGKALFNLGDHMSFGTPEQVARARELFREKLQAVLTQ